MSRPVILVLAGVVALAPLVGSTPAQAEPFDALSTESVRILTVPGTGNRTDPNTGEVIDGGVATEINNDNWVAINEVPWITFDPGFPYGSDGGLIWKGVGIPEPVAERFITNELKAHEDFVIRDLNDSGQVIGDFLPADQVFRDGFQWSSASGFETFSLGALGGEATGIDESGMFAGWRSTNDSTECGGTGGSGLCSFSGSFGGGTQTITGQPFAALDIENSLVVGNGYTWTESDGVPQPLSGGAGRAVNGAGEIAGWQIPELGRTVAAYWPDRTSAPVSIGTLPDDTHSMALGINSAGWVVGWSSTSSDPSTDRRAFLWKPETGTIEPLGTLPGGSTSAAYDINDNGLVVGEAEGRAVIWDLDGDFTIEYPDPPVIDSIPDQTVDVGKELSVQVTSSATEALYSLAVGPDGAAIGTLSGVFTWAPASDQVGAHTVTVVVTDANTFLTGTESFLVTVGSTGGDTTSPTVTIATPPDGAVYAQDEVVIADYTCTDESSGIASCVGDVAPGEAIDTSTAGDQSFTVTGTDNAGNATVVTHSYTVNAPPDVITIVVGESILVVDDHSVLPAAVIEIFESIEVSDTVTVRPPVSISILEEVSVSDETDLSPSVLIELTETVGVDDAVIVAPEALAKIGGTKWEDIDGNATRDAGELAIQGVTVYLDLDDDGTLDLGEPSKSTGPDGTYEFAGLVPGEWVVREIVPDGYVQTFPVVGGQDEHRITLTAGDTVDDADFGNKRINLPPAIEPIDDVFGFVGQEIVVVPTVIDPEGDDSYITWEGGPPNEVINGIWELTPTLDQGESLFEVTVTATHVDDPSLSASETFRVYVAALPAVQKAEPSIDPAQAQPGNQVRISGGGFLPGSDAGFYMFSDPVLLGVAVAGPDGVVDVTVTVPEHATDGPHQIVVMGVDAEGVLRVLAGDFEVVSDRDGDGLRDSEEALTGTDADDPDTDGDGLIDGIDPSWLADYVFDIPNSALKARWITKFQLRARIALIEGLVRLGHRDAALALMADLGRRVDGCGELADGNDWITDCHIQVEFRELLGTLRRNVSTMELPSPGPWWHHP